MIEMFLKGGPIMWPLLLLSLCTLAVSVDRLMFVVRTKRRPDSCSVNQILADITAGEFLNAADRAAGLGDSYGRVIAEGCRCADYAFEEAISMTAETELDRFDEGLTLLDVAITMAPLLGLLGTVTGMIRSFGILGSAELEAPVAITGGIAEALIATAFGLTIAIVALIPLSLIRREKDKFRRVIEDIATKIEIQLRARRPKSVLAQVPKAGRTMAA